VALAKAVQRELKVPEVGMATEIPELRGRADIADEDKRSGGSDDIGDISWNVPTVSVSFPSNFAAGPGHNWANAISMATPIAHKGVIAGAKVQAMTVTYTPLIRPQDTPAIRLNEETMAKYRPELKKHYYDPTKYKTYLDQLGIKYRTVR
jgi:aminobenzoyl-glutamate utilization protein B